MTRARLVLQAARKMYHRMTTDVLSEDDAWKDADNSVRAGYIKMALACYKSIASSVLELHAVPFGGCVCRGELGRPGIGTIYMDWDCTFAGVNECRTCGGEV